VQYLTAAIFTVEFVAPKLG